MTVFELVDSGCQHGMVPVATPLSQARIEFLAVVRSSHRLVRVVLLFRPRHAPESRIGLGQAVFRHRFPRSGHELALEVEIADDDDDAAYGGPGGQPELPMRLTFVEAEDGRPTEITFSQHGADQRRGADGHPVTVRVAISFSYGYLM